MTSDNDKLLLVKTKLNNTINFLSRKDLQITLKLTLHLQDESTFNKTRQDIETLTKSALTDLIDAKKEVELLLKEARK